MQALTWNIHMHLQLAICNTMLERFSFLLSDLNANVLLSYTQENTENVLSLEKTKKNCTVTNGRMDVYICIKCAVGNVFFFIFFFSSVFERTYVCCIRKKVELRNCIARFAVITRKVTSLIKGIYIPSRY